MKLPFTIASAACSALAVTSAAQTDNPVIMWVTILVNAAMLIANAGIEIYRKIRDRDKDLKKKEEEPAADETDGDEKGE